MKIVTRDFGEVEIQEEDTITFCQPIYGFEHLSRFVVLYDQDNSHFVWLQSLEEKDICFIMVNPAVVDKNYRPQLPRDVEAQLGEGEYLYWVLVVVMANFRQSTVNLRSPIIVNLQKRLAAQVILDQNLPIRYPLLGGEGGRA